MIWRMSRFTPLSMGDDEESLSVSDGGTGTEGAFIVEDLIGQQKLLSKA